MSSSIDDCLDGESDPVWETRETDSSCLDIVKLASRLLLGVALYCIFVLLVVNIVDRMQQIEQIGLTNLNGRHR